MIVDKYDVFSPELFIDDAAARALELDLCECLTAPDRLYTRQVARLCAFSSVDMPEGFAPC